MHGEVRASGDLSMDELLNYIFIIMILIQLFAHGEWERERTGGGRRSSIHHQAATTCVYTSHYFLFFFSSTRNFFIFIFFFFFRLRKDIYLLNFFFIFYFQELLTDKRLYKRKGITKCDRRHVMTFTKAVAKW